MSGWFSCSNEACLGGSLFHILCQVGVHVVMRLVWVLFHILCQVGVHVIMRLV